MVWNPIQFSLKKDNDHIIGPRFKLPINSSGKCGDFKPCCRGCGLEDLGGARVNGWNCQGPANHGRCCLVDLTHHDSPGQVAYGLPDGHAIESVLMPYQETWRTQCGSLGSWSSTELLTCSMHSRMAAGLPAFPARPAYQPNPAKLCCTMLGLLR